MNTSPIKQATQLHNQGKIDQAEKLYKEILSKEPDNPHALHFLGLILADRNQIDSAKKHLQKSIKLLPNNPVFHHNLAGFLSRSGEIEPAVNHFKKAIQLKPDYAEAYQGLTECRSFKDDSELLELIETQLTSGKLTDTQANYLHFAAAKIQADSKSFDQAFHHYLMGNKLKKATFNQKEFKQQVQGQIETFSEELVHTRKEWGLFSRTPIFIVGMPRSGTTLTEQVLSSHSDVFGAGELTDITAIIRAMSGNFKDRGYPQFIPSLSHMDLLGYGNSYITRLSQLAPNARYVVNKHPLNFKHIGLLMLMFPNARIIHTVRDPIDTCLSCFFQNFSKGQEYSFDLQNLGIFYNGYRQLMEHWKTLFPDRIYEVNYENMVRDQEPTTRSLLNYCNLAWDESCLSPHKAARQVSTASKYQVRQPVYTSSLKRWEPYKHHLQELIGVIGKT